MRRLALYRSVAVAATYFDGNNLASLEDALRDRGVTDLRWFNPQVGTWVALLGKDSKGNERIFNIDDETFRLMFQPVEDAS